MTQLSVFATEQESVVSGKKIGAFFNRAKDGFVSMWSKEDAVAEQHSHDSTARAQDQDADQSRVSDVHIDSLNPAVIAAVKFGNSHVRPC